MVICFVFHLIFKQYYEPFYSWALLLNTLFMVHCYYFISITFSIFFPYVLFFEICVCPSGCVYMCYDVLVSQTTLWISGVNLSAFVDLFTFRHDSELVLFEDLITNPSTCGLHNNLVHLWIL